jgi:hypothetical protein
MSEVIDNKANRIRVLTRIIHEGTESGSLGGVCALRMVVAA